MRTGKKLLSGEGDIEIRASSAEGIPVFSGTLTSDGGRVGPVKFQQLYTEFADTLMPGTGLFSGTLTIVKGSLEREDGTRLLLWGNISHGKEEESDVSFLAEGDILGMLPEISEAFGSAEGSGKLFLRWSGRPGDWALGSGWMEVSGGRIALNSIIKSITEINGKAELRQDERFIRIPEITGKIGSSPFLLTNTDSSAVPQGLAPLELPGLDAHIGVIQIRTEGKGLRLHIPGLMEKGEEGWLGFAGMQPGESFVIAGPASNPLLRGTLNLTDNRITYPFLKLEGDSGTSQTLELLKRVNWDLRIIPRNDVHFVREVESPFGNVIVDLKVRDDYGKFGLSGIAEEEDLQFSADLVSTEGNLLVLEHYFKPERITFSFSRGAEYPILSGRAYTTLTDSLGMPSTVWLNITAPDNELGMVMKEGSWETVRFRFSTDNPNLARNEADLLAALGFSMKDMPDRAYSALGMQVENLVFRPIFRPLERGMRRYLGLDVVHLYSMFSRNLVQLQTSSSTEFDARYLLRSTKFMLGKYLMPGLFLTYSGQFEDNLGFRYLTPGLGYRQSLTLEYTIRPDLFLQMEYTYDSQLLEDRRKDKRIWLRHIFPF